MPVHEARGYVPFLVVIFVLLTVWLWGAATLTVLIGHSEIAWIPLLGWVILVGGGLREHYRAPIRVALSDEGIEARWLFGPIHLGWDEIGEVRFLHSRWSGKPEQIEVRPKSRAVMRLTRRLSDFERLQKEMKKHAWARGLDASQTSASPAKVGR
jgi:hypothetical protein